MKRGYMDRNQGLLPMETLKTRQEKFIAGFGEYNLDAAVVFSDVASADELQYLTNLGPYWANAAGIFFKDGSSLIVTGLSARVSPWVCQITGIDDSQVVAAGPKLSSRIAEVMKKHVGETGIIGLTGKYLPQEITAALEKAGFKTVTYQANIDEQLTSRDAAYAATIKKGILLMNAAVSKVLQNPDLKNMTRKRVAAEVEYACRTAGAMDMLMLVGNEQLIFNQPEEIQDNETPWTLYVQIQYLGEWFACARNMKDDYAQEALAARDEEALTLKLGQNQLTWDKKDYNFKVSPKILSDNLSSQEQQSTPLSKNQIVTLKVTNKAKGIYLEDTYQVTAQGGLQLTNF